MKKELVIFLEEICTIVDTYIIPILPEKIQLHWYCPFAMISSDLDERWKTGVWKDESSS